MDNSRLTTAAFPKKEERQVQTGTKNVARRFDLRPWSVFFVACHPPEMTKRALEKIKETGGVHKAVIVEGPVVSVLTNSTRFNRRVTVFDNPPEWTITRVACKQQTKTSKLGSETSNDFLRLTENADKTSTANGVEKQVTDGADGASQPMRNMAVSKPQSLASTSGDILDLTKSTDEPSGACGVEIQVTNGAPQPMRANAISELHLPALASGGLLRLPGVTEEFVKDLDMTEEEANNIPFLAWYYGQLGMNLFTANFDQKKVYFMFTVDMMCRLGYYTSTYPAQILDNIPSDGKRVIKMSYHEAFGLEQLLDGQGVVVNPLKYRPAGDQVLFIQDVHVLATLSQCISPKARALNSLICRFVGLAMRTAAVNHAKAIGREEFEAAVYEPAIKSLQTAVDKEKIQRLEAEVKVITKDNEIVKALKRASDSKVETEIVKRRAIQHKETNRPLPTRFNESANTPRTGCAGVYLKKDKDGGGVVVSMHYTDMRSVGDKRRTLQQSAKRMATYKGDKRIILKLLGGTRMIDLRTNFDDAFGVVGCPNVRMPSEEAVWERLDGEFMNRASRGFALGLGWHPVEGGGEGETTRQKLVVFGNELIMDGMPAEDRRYCVDVASALGFFCNLPILPASPPASPAAAAIENENCLDYYDTNNKT